MQDEYDNEYEIFSILRSVSAWASVILAGKRGSRRHSTTSFSENVEVAETSYQMLEVLSICDRGEGVTSSTKGNSAKFSSEKWSNEAFRRVHIFRIGEKT